MAETRVDIYTRITNEIVAAIEAGAGTWKMPWHHDGSSIARPVTAAMIMADLGLAARPRSDHAAYIASWLEVLKNDKRAIFTASSKAQAAANWMHAQQRQSAVPEEKELTNVLLC